MGTAALYKISFWIFCAYLYIAAILFLIGAWNQRNFDEKPLLGLKWLNNYFVYVGGFIGLSCFFYSGFDSVLSFIPNDWGFYDELGDFTSWRSWLSGLFSFILVVLTSKIIIEYRTGKPFLCDNKKKIKKKKYQPHIED